MLKVLPSNSVNLFGVCPNVSLFTSNSVHLCPLFLSAGLLGQGSINLAYALKNKLIDSLVLCIVFLFLYHEFLLWFLYCSQVDLGLVGSCFCSFEFPH